MIFAAETEERSLHVFPDAETAASYCDGLAVEATLWLFWDDDGAPMEPQFTIPNQRGVFLGKNGTYLVFREMEQDVFAFWRYLAASREPGATPVDKAVALGVTASFELDLPLGAAITGAAAVLLLPGALLRRG